MNFKEKVLQIVKQIPYGRVTTYGTVATLAGVPRGGRLVGGVLHFNIDLPALPCRQAGGRQVLPWHRVINRHGFISTRCLDHPKQLQKALLEQEGIEVSSDFMVNLDRYGWFGDKVAACLVKKHRSTRSS